MLLPSLSRYEGFLHSIFAVAASLNPSWVYLYCCQHLVTTISDFLWLIYVCSETLLFVNWLFICINYLHRLSHSIDRHRLSMFASHTRYYWPCFCESVEPWHTYSHSVDPPAWCSLDDPGERRMTDNYRAMYAVPTVHEPLPWVQTKLNPMTVISWSFVSNACTYDVITSLPEPACDLPTTSYRSKCLKPAHLHMSPRLLQISGFHTPGMPLVVPPVCPRRLTAGTAPGSPSLTDRLGRQPLPSSDGVPTLSPSRRFAFRRYRPLGDPTLLLAASSGAAPRSRAATSWSRHCSLTAWRCRPRYGSR